MQTEPLPSGYTLEARIPWAVMGTQVKPAADQVIGIGYAAVFEDNDPPLSKEVQKRVATTSRDPTGTLTRFTDLILAPQEAPMFPIGDQDVAREKLSYITYLLLAINILVFLFIQLPRLQDQQFFQTWGAVPANLEQGQNLITIITSMFLHGGWMHLIGNMLFLWVFGDNVETVLGHIPFLIFYMLGGFAATFAHIMTNMGSDMPSVGASGAISAVLGAYLVMFPSNKVRLLVLGRGLGTTYVSALFFLGLWAVIQLINGIGALAQTAETGGVAFWAHIGGFLLGIVAGILFRGRAAQHQVEPVRQTAR